MRIDWSRSLRDANKIAVGVVAMIVIAGAVAVALAVGTLHIFQSRYAMSGVFTDTGGVQKGDPVRVAGIVVGEVTGVTPDRRHGDVVVTWSVNSGVEVGHDATADVALSTLLGGQYIRLSGAVTRPYMADLPEDRRRIPLDRTRTPYEVLGVLGTATHDINQVDIGAVDRMMGDFADLADGQQVPTRELLAGFDQVAGALADRRAQLESLVGESEKLTGALAQKDAAIAQLIDASGALLDNIAARRDQLAAVLGNGSKAVAAMTALLERRRAELDAILNNLHIGLQAIARQQPSVDRGLAWLGPTFASTALIGTHGPWLDGLLIAAPPNLAQMIAPPAGGPGPAGNAP